jgi:hypothetical protein
LPAGFGFFPAKSAVDKAGVSTVSMPKNPVSVYAALVTGRSTGASLDAKKRRRPGFYSIFQIIISRLPCLNTKQRNSIYLHSGFLTV